MSPLVVEEMRYREVNYVVKDHTAVGLKSLTTSCSTNGLRESGPLDPWRSLHIDVCEYFSERVCKFHQIITGATICSVNSASVVNTLYLHSDGCLSYLLWDLTV